jgi:hypothetical protein
MELSSAQTHLLNSIRDNVAASQTCIMQCRGRGGLTTTLAWWCADELTKPFNPLRIVYWAPSRQRKIQFRHHLDDILSDRPQCAFGRVNAAGFKASNGVVLDIAVAPRRPIRDDVHIDVFLMDRVLDMTAFMQCQLYYTSMIMCTRDDEIIVGLPLSLQSLVPEAVLTDSLDEMTLW